MSIESSPPAPTPSAKTAAHGHGAKARSTAPDSAGGAAGGFMAMLGALADAGLSSRDFH